jgi:hypothetical protein
MFKDSANDTYIVPEILYKQNPRSIVCEKGIRILSALDEK